MNTATKPSPFAGGIAALAASSALEGLLETEGVPFMVNLDQILIEEQARTEFESEEYPLEQLAASLKVRQFHPIILEILPFGSEFEYKLVTGERRCKAARLAGMTQLQAVAFTFAEGEAIIMQHDENRLHKPLTIAEESRAMEMEIKRLGSVKAYIDVHHKRCLAVNPHAKPLTPADVSKRMSIAKGGVSVVRAAELTDDVEALSELSKVERVAPEVAKEVVTAIKEGAPPRATIKEARAKVDPPKTRAPKAKSEGGSGQVATPKDRSAEEPGEVLTSTPAAPAVSAAPVAWSPAVELERAHKGILAGADPEELWSALGEDERGMCEETLEGYFDMGRKASAADGLRTIASEMNNGVFGASGAGLFYLLAFVAGSTKGRFSVVEILAAAKP